jgi:hypothetical protein
MAVVAIMGKAAFIDSSHLHELRTTQAQTTTNWD